MAEPAATTPLVSSSRSTTTTTTTSTNDGYIVQTLHGKTYALNPTRIPPPSPLTPTALLVRTLTVLALSPLLLVGGSLLTTALWLGPQWLRHKLLSLYVPRVLTLSAKRFSQERKALLTDLHGKVLDVGCGTGSFVRRYTNATHVVALEPVQEFHASIQREADEWLEPHNTQLTLLSCDLETFLREHPEERGTFDWVILGNVLCEVKNVQETLRDVDGALKDDDGYVYFCEHTGCVAGSWKRVLQNCINPWWRVIGGGCNLNLDTLNIMIQSMPHWEIVSWSFENVQPLMGPFVVGLAYKNSSSRRE